MQHLAGLIGDGLHRAQQRGLFVQRLAGVGAERSGDAQRIILHKGVAGGVPGGVAAGLGRSAQAAGREAGRIRLALHKLLAGKLHNNAAVFGGADEAVVLFTGHARQRLEPVGIVRGAVLNGPVLHGVGHHVGYFHVQRRTAPDRLMQRFISRARQALFHHVVVEYHAAENFRSRRCHTPLLLFSGVFCILSLRTASACLNADKKGAVDKTVHSAFAVLWPKSYTSGRRLSTLFSKFLLFCDIFLFYQHLFVMFVCFAQE